jgi:hypothetical protein
MIYGGRWCDQMLLQECNAVGPTQLSAPTRSMPPVCCSSAAHGMLCIWCTTWHSLLLTVNHTDASTHDSARPCFVCTVDCARAGIQQPYYHLPKTFFSSAYVRAAEAAAPPGTTLQARHEH